MKLFHFIPKSTFLIIILSFQTICISQTSNWISTWQPGGTLSYHSSVIDVQGNIYVGYYSWDETNQINKLGIVKHNSQGGFVWDITVKNSGYSSKMKLCYADEKIYAWIKEVVYIYSVEGALLNSFPAAYQNTQNIFVNADGEVIVTFFWIQHDGGAQGFGAAKFNAAGLLVWDDVYREVTPNNGYLVDSEMDAEGNIYLAGIDNQNALLIKAGSNGLKIWENQYTSTNIINDLELGVDNCVYIAGSSKSTNMASISRFNSDGTFSWTKNYTDAQGNGEYMKLLKSNSGVYVAGYHGVQGVGNILLARHYSTNGDLLLEYSQEDPSIVPQIAYYEANYGFSLIYNGSLFISCQFTTNNEFYYGLIKLNSQGSLAGYSYTLGTNYGLSCLTFDSYLYGGSIIQTNIEPLANLSNLFQLKIISYPTNITSVEGEEEVELSFSLAQNYPNPFNPSTTINYSISETGNVKLEVFNSLGQIVETLVDGHIEKGTHSAIFQADEIPTGVYFYKLSLNNNYQETKKMLLIK